MTRTYTWSATVAAAIAALPLDEGRLPEGDSAFWSLLEGRNGIVAPEILAFLVRSAYASGQRAAAERVVAVLWDRYAGHIVTYARNFQGRLRGAITIEDVVVDVFALLCRRLRDAPGPTFYEACFFAGLKRLTLDKVQRMDDEPVVSLTTHVDDGEEEEQQDLPDHAAIDPAAYSEESERRAHLRQALPPCLDGLAPKALETARLLMQGRTEGEIAATLGVSTRMVTNYKAAIRERLAPLRQYEPT